MNEKCRYSGCVQILWTTTCTLKRYICIIRFEYHCSFIEKVCAVYNISNIVLILMVHKAIKTQLQENSMISSKLGLWSEQTLPWENLWSPHHYMKKYSSAVSGKCKLKWQLIHIRKTHILEKLWNINFH